MTKKIILYGAKSTGYIFYEMLKEKKIINGLTLVALQWFFLEYYKG